MIPILATLATDSVIAASRKLPPVIELAEVNVMPVSILVAL